MPSVARTVCLGFYAISLVFLASPFTATPALANPLPFAFSTVDSGSSDLVSRGRHLTTGLEDEHDLTTYHTRSLNVTESRRQLNNDLNDFGLFSDYANKFSQSANAFQSMSGQASSQGSSAAFQKSFSGELSTFHQTFAGFSGNFDKGLANYNKNDQFETLLKNSINFCKDGMKAVYNAINSNSALGPLVGPTLYAIKCLVDDVLDITENTTDGTWDDLMVDLQELLGTCTTATCISGIQLLGLCVL